MSEHVRPMSQFLVTGVPLSLTGRAGGVLINVLLTTISTDTGAGAGTTLGDNITGELTTSPIDTGQNLTERSM